MMSTSRASRGSKDKSTKTHTAQKGPSQNVKPDPPTMTSKQIQPTAEQMRIASAINNDRNEEDPEVQEKIQLVKEIYGNISDDTIFFTLHEHDFDLNKAVNALGDKQNPPADGKWESAATKKKKSSKTDVPPPMDKPDRGDAGDRERGVSSGRGSNRRDKGPPRFQRGRGRENSEGGHRRGGGGGQEDGEAGSRERNNFEGRAGRGRGRGGGRGGRGRGGRYDRNVGNMDGSRNNHRSDSGLQSQFDSFDTHIDTWTNEVAEKGNNIGSWPAEDWTADEWQGSLEQSTVFTASSTNDTSSNVFQTDATNNDNDAQMFSVSAIETQVFTAKSLPSNEGAKNSYGLSGQTTSSTGQPVNSVGTIGQQSTGGNQNAGTIGQNSLGQKAMGNQQQPSQLGQRLNIEDLLPKTVTPPATAPMTGTEFLSQYAAKQAEEDIRSAVGIRPPQATAPPTTVPISRPAPQQQDNRQQQKKTRLPPPSKIPASAVEMPGGVNYNQDAVQVQFGNWDSDSGGFSFGAGTTDNGSTNGNHFNGTSHQRSSASNPPSSQPMAQALTSTAMSSGRVDSSPRTAATAGNTYPSTPPKQQPPADAYSQQKQESAFPPPPSQQQEQRKASPYAGATAPPHRQQQQQAATGSLGSANKPLSASYNQSGFTSPSSGSSGYPGSFKSQSLSQSASAGYPSSTQRGESSSSSQYDSPRTSASYSSSQQQQQQQATSEAVSSSSASSSSFQQSSQPYTTSASSSSAFQPSSVSSAPTSTYSSSASGDNASVSAAGGSSYQGTYNSSSSYQPSSAFHRSSGSDYSQQNQQSSGGSSFGESTRSQQQSSVYNSSSSSQYHQGTSSASSGYRDSSSVSSGGAGSYGATGSGSAAPYGSVSAASPQAGSNNSQLNKLTNSLAKMATKDTSSEHEAASRQQQYEQSVSSSASTVSSSVISSSTSTTTTSKQTPLNPVTTAKAPPNLPPGVPPGVLGFNMINQHGLPPAFYNIPNLQQPQQQPPQPDAAAMYNLDHIQMLQQQGRFPPMPGSGYPYDMPLQPNIAAAAVAAATAQQLQTAAAVPSTIPDQKLSAGYPGDSKMTRLEAQSPVNAISTSQHGSQQQGGQQQGQGQPQQGAAAGQSQNSTAAFTLPPGYYNYYNNPPVLPGGYSYPPNMFPVPSVTSHGGAGSSSQYGKPATYPTAYNNYDSLAVAAAAAQNHQQQQQDYKNKGVNVSQPSSGSVSDGLGGGSYGVTGKSGSGFEKSYHHAAGTPPPPQPGAAGGFTSLLQATSNSSSMPTAAAAGAYGGAYVVPSHTPAHVAAAAGMVAPHHLPQDSVSALGRGASGQTSSGAPKTKYQTPYWSN